MQLDDIEAIRQLKYSYFRLLDTKRFTELGELLTENATSAYQSGRLSHNSRAAIVAFLDESLGDRGIVTMHTGHHPEIIVTSPTTAVGTWYLEDRVIVPAHDFRLEGTGIYRDEYVKMDGRWMIGHTGYDRIYEQRSSLATGALIDLSSMFEPET